jgi:hypothetical protein
VKPIPSAKNKPWPIKVGDVYSYPNSHDATNNAHVVHTVNDTYVISDSDKWSNNKPNLHYLWWYRKQKPTIIILDGSHAHVKNKR